MFISQFIPWHFVFVILSIIPGIDLSETFEPVIIDNQIELSKIKINWWTNFYKTCQVILRTSKINYIKNNSYKNYFLSF